MKAGLITLADIGQIGSERNPRSQITVARMGKYHDARYGNFSMSEADFEGWSRNLATTFGGRVSVDFDHSSDRGRGTEAAGWIVGLERQGKDLIADVEWTPKGAAAIRDKAYQFISPTYSAHYKDEHGVDRGPALIGAACTNRPVLRQLPTLSLSRQAFDGGAVPKPRKKDRAVSKKTKSKTLSREATKLRVLPSTVRKELRGALPLSPKLAPALEQLLGERAGARVLELIPSRIGGPGSVRKEVRVARIAIGSLLKFAENPAALTATPSDTKRWRRLAALAADVLAAADETGASAL